MAKVFQAVGILLALGVAAAHLAGGSNHSYDITFVMRNGVLAADKAQPSPHLVAKKHSTTWTFTNRAGADVEFQVYEPEPCHFRFTPAGNTDCASKLVRIAADQPQRIVAHVVKSDDGKCTDKAPCAGIVNARLVTDSLVRRVDPDLQIERDNLADWQSVLLAVLAGLLLVAPPILGYLNRRRAGEVN